MNDNVELYFTMAIRSYLGTVDYELEDTILNIFKYLKFAYTQEEIIDNYCNDEIIYC